MFVALRAFAKLNLSLEVLSRRADGYHEIRSVLQTVSLSDTLTFQSDTRITVTVENAVIPEEDNLVIRAARLLQQETGVSHGARIRVEKHVPLAAGLGGGSTDAAATLWALNSMWETGLPPARLSVLAASLGSDVPFFLQGGTAVVGGRGELIEPLARPARRWFLVLHPPLALPEKTSTMYSHLPQSAWSNGRVTEELSRVLQTARRIREAYLYNAFETIAFDLLPELHDWRRRLLEVAPSRPHLAGAGPSLFIPVESEEHGHRVIDQLAAQDEQALRASCFVVQTVPAAREVLAATSSSD